MVPEVRAVGRGLGHSHTRPDTARIRRMARNGFRSGRGARPMRRLIERTSMKRSATSLMGQKRTLIGLPRSPQSGVGYAYCRPCPIVAEGLP